MINWYKKVVFENYANFKGRARRSEYWYFALASTIISMILSLLDNLMSLKIGGSESGILSSLYSLVVFVPSIGVSVRRLHDIGKSGKFLLLFYVALIALAVIMFVSGFSMIMSGSGMPGIGFFIPLLLIIAMAIYMLVLMCTNGDQGPNKYGPDPKGNGEEINEIGVE